MRLARAAAVGMLALALPGCSSATLADLDPARSDPDARREALLELERRSAKETELRAPLADKARERLEHDESVSVRLVAARVVGKLALAGAGTREGAHALGLAAIGSGTGAAAKRDELRWLSRDTSSLWVRIEAIEDLALLWHKPIRVEDREEVRVLVLLACTQAIRPDLESEPEVRIHAARELALIAPRKGAGLAALVAALDDPMPDVHHHAQQALVAIAGGDHGPTRDDWERWRKSVDTGDEK
ncbi:hypothetical protein HY251_21350 [bacterium]|nr:hypothetical protein [bacterium]